MSDESIPKPSSIPRPHTTPTKSQSHMTLYGYKSPRDGEAGVPSPRASPMGRSNPLRMSSREELQALKDEIEQKESLLSSIKGETMTLRTTVQRFEVQHQTLEEDLVDKQRDLKILTNRMDSLKTDSVNNKKDAERHYELKYKEMKLQNDTAMYNLEKLYKTEIERILADKVGKIQEEKLYFQQQVKDMNEDVDSDSAKLEQSLKELVDDMKRKENEVRSFMAKDLEELEEEEKSLDTELGKVEMEIEMLKNKLLELKQEEDSKSQELDSNKLQNSQRSADLKELEMKYSEMQKYIHLTNENISKLKTDLEVEKTQTKKYEDALLLEEEKRRKAHNKLQELKGNIRVFCRIRPMLPFESNESMLRVQVPDNDEVKQEIYIEDSKARASSNGEIKRHHFNFDKVFQQSSTNPEIFEEISQLVQSALYGFNVCIFAYGQTGSGKTYTMSSEDGIIPLTVNQIFETCDKLRTRDYKFKIFGEFLQIYNETIMDLINGSEQKHEIKHDQQSKTTYITNLTRIQFESPEDMNKTLHRALDNRSIATTKSNERSSRSHTVCIIRIEVTNPTTQESYSSVLNLIDLAGSERIAQSQVVGDRLKETQAINKSLSCLGDVIHALGDESSKHVPFRNSKLTYLLQYSLMEDSKTLMFVNVSPLEKHISETINSLRFATKVNNTGLQRKT